MIALLAAAIFAQDFSYEIARAKRALGEYGEQSYREERIHLRRGAGGSSIETFCATTQARDSEGKVDERSFFWVVRVAPAKGYLSDYDRGTWDQSPADGKSDFRKLCVETGEVDDSALLRSKNHSSSGSTYDPTSDATHAPSAAWLVGDWVTIDSCATSRDVGFRADGVYERHSDRGRWRFAGTAVELEINEQAVGGGEEDGGGYVGLARPRHERIPVAWLGIDAMRLGTTRMMRC